MDARRQRDSIIARAGNKGHIAGLKDKLDALMQRVRNTNRSTEQDIRRGELIVDRIKKMSNLADPNSDVGYLDQHIRTLRDKLDKASVVNPPPIKAAERLATTLKDVNQKTIDDHHREVHRNMKRQAKMKIIDEDVTSMFMNALQTLKETKEAALNKGKEKVIRIDDKAETESPEEQPKKPKGHPVIHTAKTKELSEGRKGVHKNNPARKEVRPSVHRKNDKPKQDE